MFSYSWAVNKYLKNNFTDVLSTQESDKIQMTFLLLEQACHFFLMTPKPGQPVMTALPREGCSMQLRYLYFTSYVLFTKPELISMELFQ